jgi:hypothetical protein
MAELIEVTEQDDYHGRKLRKLLKHIATDGRYANIIIISLFPLIFIYHRKRVPRSRGNPGSRGFKVTLD